MECYWSVQRQDENTHLLGDPPMRKPLIEASSQIMGINDRDDDDDDDDDDDFEDTLFDGM